MTSGSVVIEGVDLLPAQVAQLSARWQIRSVFLGCSKMTLNISINSDVRAAMLRCLRRCGVRLLRMSHSGASSYGKKLNASAIHMWI